jgi:murein DD-endopeptidase MepM/ murein hydrolase activator NlpD
MRRSLYLPILFVGVMVGLLTTEFTRQSRSIAEALVLTSPAPPQQPLRPLSGGITLGFNKSASWASKPHNGIDYTSDLGNSIKSAGNGVVYFYTKPDAGRFGSINPDGLGPAIWIRYKLATGEPIYVLYGHSASSYVDKSSGSGKNFKFNCKYTINLSSGSTVRTGDTIAKTTPYYLNGKPAQHLHVSVFKPDRKRDGSYYGPPSSNWGYSDIRVNEGTYINPEEFFTNSQYKLSPNP